MNNTENSLPIIQSLWIGDALSVMERLCISSFLSNGHTFHLYTYGGVKNVPKGTILKDAAEIINPDKIFKYKGRDTFAGFADFFRYKLIYEKGSYWVDTDIVCLRPFNLHQEYVFAGAKKRKLFGLLGDKFRVGCSVIKTPPGSEIMNYCYEVSSGKILQEMEWGEIGPKLLETAVIKFGLQDSVACRGTFSTIEWDQWHRFISDSLLVSWQEQARIALYKSRSIHLFNEMWRLNGVDKNARFPKRSMYEMLKRRYLHSAEN